MILNKKLIGAASMLLCFQSLVGCETSDPDEGQAQGEGQDKEGQGDSEGLGGQQGGSKGGSGEKNDGTGGKQSSGGTQDGTGGGQGSGEPPVGTGGNSGQPPLDQQLTQEEAMEVCEYQVELAKKYYSQDNHCRMLGLAGASAPALAERPDREIAAGCTEGRKDCELSYESYMEDWNKELSCEGKVAPSNCTASPRRLKECAEKWAEHYLNFSKTIPQSCSSFKQATWDNHVDYLHSNKAEISFNSVCTQLIVTCPDYEKMLVIGSLFLMNP